MGRIGLVRHGYTDWNDSRRLQGSTDIPLNDTGREQAGKLAERLAGEDWQLIVSSDLSRAQETAGIVAERLGLDVISDARLRERSCGLAEGKTLDEVVLLWGENWEERVGFEPETEVAERAVSCIEEMVERYPQTNILFVTHGATLRLTLSRLIGEPRTSPIGNTSLTVVEQDQGRWVERLFNCCAHL